MDNDRWQARIASIPQVFAAAAKGLGRRSVDKDVVRKVWDRLTPGLLEVGVMHPSYLNHQAAGSTCSTSDTL